MRVWQSQIRFVTYVSIVQPVLQNQGTNSLVHLLGITCPLVVSQ